VAGPAPSLFVQVASLLLATAVLVSIDLAAAGHAPVVYLHVTVPWMRAAAAAASIVVWLALVPGLERRGERLAALLLVGGGLSNLAVRLLLGAVPDYLVFRHGVALASGPKGSWVFNAGDLTIAAGALLLAATFAVGHGRYADA
jgi:lipoprotein signal peptidase